MKIKLKNMTDVNCFVESTQYYKGYIDVEQGRYTIDGRSFLGLCSLDLNEPVLVTIKTDDKDVENDFYNMLRKWSVE